MPSWLWIVFPIVGIVDAFLILVLQKVPLWLATLVGIAEGILTYILSITVLEMRIHPENVTATSYIIPVSCAILMFVLFFFRGKNEKKA